MEFPASKTKNFSPCPHCKKKLSSKKKLVEAWYQCEKCGNMGQVERTYWFKQKEVNASKDRQEEQLFIATCFATSN